MQVDVVLVPAMVPLDVAGPYEVLARVPGWTLGSPMCAGQGLRPCLRRDERLGMRRR